MSTALTPCELLESRRLLASGFTLTINGTGGDDTIVLNVGGGNIVYTVNGTPTSVLDNFFNEIAIFGHGGDDQIDINSTGDDNIVAVNGGTENDILRLAPLAQNLDAIASDFSFNGSAGNDELLLFDETASGNMTFAITSNSLTRSPGLTGSIAFTDLSSMSLRCGSGNDVILVNANVTPLTVLGGIGDDRMELAPGSRNLDDIDAAVGFYGSAGVNQLVLDDRDNAALRDFTVRAGVVQRDAFPGALYDGALARIEIRAGGGDNHFEIGTGSVADLPALAIASGSGFDTIDVNDHAEAAAVSYLITAARLSRSAWDGLDFSGNENLSLGAGSGDDTITFGEGTLSGIRSTDVHGGGGFDTVIVNDAAHPSPAEYTIASFIFDRTDFSEIDQASVERIIVNGGSASNDYFILGNLGEQQTTLNAGGASDRITLDFPNSGSPGETRAPNVSAVTVAGGGGSDRLFIDDSINGFADAFMLTSTALTRTAFDGLSYAAVEEFALVTGEGGNTIDVNSTINGATAIDAGFGDDTVNVNGNFHGTAVEVDGGAGADVVTVNADNVGQAAVRFARTQDLARLELGAQATVTVDPGGDKVLVTQALIFPGLPGSTSARLDLNDNALIRDYSAVSPIGTIRALLANGHNGGAWNGNGIFSGRGNATQFALGFAESADLFNAFPATFAGQSIDSTAVLVRFTRYGDANLDHAVNLQDFNRLASHFGSATTLWNRGNLNYDAQVNLQDFNLLAISFGLSADTGDDREDAPGW
jgi:hypothetical protein